MQEQTYRNHTRYSIAFHFIGTPVGVAALIGSIINVVNSSKDNLYSASLLVVISFSLLLLSLNARRFALRAQDRAIRAEENFRHFVLTGKPFDSRLRISQIIALRFASDEELPALAEKAVNENLKNNEIKKQIKNWRADHHRV